MSNYQIQKRQLGASSLMVSEVGLGCWQLGGDFGPIGDEQATGILRQAVNDGISFFDTADVYGGGKSEQYLGATLNNIAPDAIIATKYGRGQGTYPDGYSLDDMRDSVLRAQDRLQQDCLDLLQLHCIPKSVLERGEVFDWLRQLQQQGLIAYFGASVETLEEAHICTAQDDLTSLQIIFNLMRQRPAKDLFAEAKERQVGIIVRLPLASGMLSGKFDQNTSFDPTDHRHYNKDGEAFSVGETFSGIEFSQGLKLVKALEDFKPAQMSMAAFAMRWILDFDAVSCIIPGASSPRQVSQNASVSQEATLAPELHEQLYQLYLEQIEPAIRCPI